MEHHQSCTLLTGFNQDLTYVSCQTPDAMPNRDYEVHAHYQEFEVYHFLEGDLFFSYEGRHIGVENGTMIIIANGVLHRPIIKSNCFYYRKRILFNKDIFLKTDTIDFELYNRLTRRRILVLSKGVVEKTGLDRLMDEIEDYLSQKSKYGDFCAFVSLLSLLIKAEEHSQQLETLLLPSRNDHISKILEYINQHLSEELDYPVLSKLFNMSEKSLYKFFKKETGFALSNYINQRRIIMAQSLLLAGASAKTAAYNVGFHDYSSFYRCFVQKVGMTPSDYVKANRHI